MSKIMNEYINQDSIVSLLGSLIRIYSPYFREQEIMDFTYDWLNNRGLSPELHKYADNKITKYSGTNIVGSIKGSRKGPRILLNGHLDTVEICNGWAYKPLEPTVVDNKMYGLGALDMKSGVAAILIAINAFKNTVRDFKGELIYTLVSDEEGPYGLGTDSLIVDGRIKDIDAAIVTEPSSGFANLKFPCLCLGARGGYNYTVSFKGKSAHAANPEAGISAISEASKVLLELEKTELKEDPKLGKGSICVIGMRGGGAACSVADSASFTIFRHVVRGETKEYLEKEVKAAIKRANIRGTATMEFRDSPHPDNAGFEPYIIDEKHPYTEKFKESIRTVTNTNANEAYFSSIGDFNYIGSRLKIPTFVFGPNGNNYHSADEYVNIDSVVKTAEVLYDYFIKMLVEQ